MGLQTDYLAYQRAADANTEIFQKNREFGEKKRYDDQLINESKQRIEKSQFEIEQEREQNANANSVAISLQDSKDLSPEELLKKSFGLNLKYHRPDEAMKNLTALETMKKDHNAEIKNMQIGIQKADEDIDKEWNLGGVAANQRAMEADLKKHRQFLGTYGKDYLTATKKDDGTYVTEQDIINKYKTPKPARPSGKEHVIDSWQGTGQYPGLDGKMFTPKKGERYKAQLDNDGNVFAMIPDSGISPEKLLEHRDKAEGHSIERDKLGLEREKWLNSLDGKEAQTVAQSRKQLDVELKNNATELNNKRKLAQQKGFTGDKDKFIKNAEAAKQVADLAAENAHQQIIKTVKERQQLRTGGGQNHQGQQAQLPPQVLKILQDGQAHKFKNGQTWKLQDGKPVQVQ